MSQLHGDTSRRTLDSGLVSVIENSNGTKIEKIWAYNRPLGAGSASQINPFVKTEFTSIKNASGSYALTAIKEFAQDKNGNTTSIKEYGFVPYANVPRSTTGCENCPTGLPSDIGAPVRETVTSYFNSTPDSSDVTTDTTYGYWNFSNVKGVVAATEVKDGSGQIFSRTEISYDNFSTTANPTATKVWDSFKGGTSRSLNSPDSNGSRLDSNNSIPTSVEYNGYGMPTKTTDANGVQSTIAYGTIGGYTDLYPTQTEAASNYSTLKRTSTATFDFNTGLPITSFDVDNGLTNKTEYDDLGRPKKAISAYGIRPTNHGRQPTIMTDRRRIIIDMSSSNRT